MHSRLVLPFFGAQLATSTSGNRRRSNAVPEPDCLVTSLWDRRYESFCPLTPRHKGLSRNAPADFSTEEECFSPSLFQNRNFNLYPRGKEEEEETNISGCDHAWIWCR